VLPLCIAGRNAKRGLRLFAGGVAMMACHHALNFSRNVGVGGEADPRLALGVAAAFAVAVIALFAASRHLPSHGPVDMLARRLRFMRRAPRRADRARRGRRSIGRYVASSVALWTLAALATAVALLQMVDLFEKGEDFVERGMGPAEVLRYVGLRLPVLVQQSIPIALLSGAMIAFFRLARRQEVTAMRAFGLSQYRLLAAALPVAAAMSLAVLALSEVVSPKAQVALSSWWRATAPEGDETSERWFRIGRDIVRSAAADEAGGRLEKVTIFRRGQDGLLSERIEAAAAQVGPAGWTLSNAETWRFAGSADTVSTARRSAWETPLKPEDVRAFFAASPQISSAAALRALETTAPVDRRAAFFETRLHRLLAEPLAPIVMLLLALPVAFASVRRGRSWVPLLYAGGGGLLYLVSDGVLTVAAQTGMVAPWVGAWAAPIILGLTAATVLLYSER
jgi:lipopolysaccharide export system permease protein